MSSIIKVDTIQNAAGTTGLTIDSNGVVSKGVVPAWNCSLTSLQALTDVGLWNTVAFDKTTGGQHFIQGGCTLSSNKITVPVSGIYQINSTLRVDGIGSGYIIMSLSINGSDAEDNITYVIDGTASPTYTNLNASEIYKLDANDTVEVKFLTQVDSSYTISTISSFSGALVG